MESKVDKLDVNKLVPVPIDLKKLNDIVDNEVVQKGVYDEFAKNVNASDTSGLKASYDAKINEMKLMVKYMVLLV